MTHSVPRTFSPSSLQNHAQHAMRRRMLRAHVDDEFVGVEKGLLVVVEFEMRSAVGSLSVVVESRSDRSLPALDPQVDLHPLVDPAE